MKIWFECWRCAGKFWYDHRVLLKIKECMHCGISFENIKPKRLYRSEFYKTNKKTRIEMMEDI